MADGVYTGRILLGIVSVLQEVVQYALLKQMQLSKSYAKWKKERNYKATI